MDGWVLAREPTGPVPAAPVQPSQRPPKLVEATAADGGTDGDDSISNGGGRIEDTTMQQ